MNLKDPGDVRSLRKRLGLNQTEFWGHVGVGRARGSRYEAIGEIPMPVQELLRIVFIEGVEMDRIESEDLEAIHYLKQTDPRLFEEFKKRARALASRDALLQSKAMANGSLSAGTGSVTNVAFEDDPSYPAHSQRPRIVSG